jgi:hypothetical protein
MSDVGLEVVRFVYDRMKIDQEWSVWHQRGFTWWGHWLAQHIWADPCFEDQGLLISRVHARTDLLDGFIGSDEQCVTLMQLITPLTSMSGPIRDPRNRTRVQLAANVYVHAETKDWLGAVLAEAAIIQADDAHRVVERLARAVNARPAYSAHPRSGSRKIPDDILGVPSKLLVPMGQEPSRYQGQGMLDAIGWLQGPPCVLAMGDEKAFCAEFPFGAFTSLLQVRTDLPHSILGNGLYMRLQPHEGPSGWESPEAARMALELNEREQREFPYAHFLGSWCPAPLCFLSFFPNSSCPDDKRWITTLVQKAEGRAHWTAVDVFQAGWDFERAAKLKREMIEDFDRGLESAAEAIEAEEEKRMKPEPNPSIRFPCPHCGRTLKAPAEKSGATSRCPFCRQAVTVPAAGTVGASSPSAAPKLEPAPEVNPAALALLARAKAETRGDCRRPCGPFVEPNLGNLWGEMIPLVRWGIFNPNGPTMDSVFLIRPVGAKESLIVHIMSSPFAGIECSVRGWHPEVINAGILEQTLTNIGKAQAGARPGNDHPLLLYPPSVVQLLPSSPLPRESLKRVFKGFLLGCDAVGIDQRCQEMRRHWCSPWERVRVLWDALAEMVDRLPPDTTDSERLEKTIALTDELSGDKPMDDSDFEEWWALVTSDDHVAIELGLMSQAWEGAIEHGSLPSIGTNPGLTIHGSFEDEAWARLRALAALYISRSGRELEDDTDTKSSRLDLSKSPVTDTNLAELYKVRFVLPPLRLNLSDTVVTDAGLRYLQGMDCIGWLNLTGTKATARGVANLRKALPKAKIIGP